MIAAVFRAAAYTLTTAIRRWVAPVPLQPCARHSADITTPFCGDCGWPWHTHHPAARAGGNGAAAAAPRSIP